MTEVATILAIETATSNCSVALEHQGRVFSRALDGNNVHSQVLLNMVNEVLQDAGIQAAKISAVAVGQGPGSFTGLRIGVGVAQGIAYGVGCPMIGVSSLDALANLAAPDAPENIILAGIDARMNEIYWCAYQASENGLVRQGPLQVSAPEAIALAPAIFEPASAVSAATKVTPDSAPSTKPEPKTNELALTLVGNAWAVYAGRFAASIEQHVSNTITHPFPTAESVLVLAKQSLARGETIAPIDFAPEYVRNDVAKKSRKKIVQN